MARLKKRDVSESVGPKNPKNLSKNPFLKNFDTELDEPGFDINPKGLV